MPHSRLQKVRKSDLIAPKFKFLNALLHLDLSNFLKATQKKKY